MFVVQRGNSHYNFETRQQAIDFARSNAVDGQPWNIRLLGEARQERSLSAEGAFVDAGRSSLFGSSWRCVR